MPHIEKDWDKALGISETIAKDMAMARQAELLVDEELTDAQFDTSEVRELAQNSLDFLAALAMPLVFKFCFPPVLMAAWQLVTDAAVSLQLIIQLALGIPRGHGKTTFIKLFVLWCILFTKKKFILISCDITPKAENILADIVDMLNEPNIIRTFGDWKSGLELDRQELKKFGYRGRPVILVATGSDGSIRGLNLKNERPDVIIFDDIQTKECSESKIQSEALERWMYGTAMKAKSPSGCLFIFAGNMFPGPNSILKKIKSNPTWTKFISGAILADGTALWEELRPLESLIQEFDNDLAADHPEIFYSEVMNDVEAGINTKVDLTLIKPWKWGEGDLPQGKFLMVDPAAKAKGGDATVIGYYEIYDGQLGLRSLIEEHLSPGNTIRRAILLCLQTGTRLIAVESVGYQSTLLYWFEQITQQLQLTGFYFVPIHSGSHSKNSRISAMLKGLTAGEVVLHDSIKYLVTAQIANWNPLKRDNEDGILDILTYGPPVMKNFGGLSISLEEQTLVEDVSEGVLEYNSAF